MKNDVKEEIEEKKETEKKETTKNEETKKEFKKVNDNKKEMKNHMKVMEEDKNPKKGKTWTKLLIIIIVILVIGILFSTIFALININNSKILSGISIEGIEVSGLSKEEAMAKVKIL